ncbi:DUF1737 domain-containing protein [Acetobacteraceae bacterium]|nr:DUF1737 domain-containing protein [Acetobacteraceae bacterium]
MSEYTILHDTDYEDLSDTVNQCMADGFRPHGSLVVVMDKQGTPHFHQPMVKYTEDE